MQRNWRVTPSFILVPLLGVLAVVSYPSVVRWLTDNGAVTRPPSGNKTPSLIAEGAQSIIVRDQNGNKAWEFAAKRIVVSADRRYCTATDVYRGTLYRNGKPFLKLKARQVRLNQETRNLEAQGTVSASGPDGLTVHTERADWQHREQRLSCPGVVNATLRGLKIDTKTAFYDARTSKLHCPQAVQVQSERATLQGFNAVADTKTRRLEFNQGVQIAITPP